MGACRDPAREPQRRIDARARPEKRYLRAATPRNGVTDDLVVLRSDRGRVFRAKAFVAVAKALPAFTSEEVLGRVVRMAPAKSYTTV